MNSLALRLSALLFLFALAAGVRAETDCGSLLNAPARSGAKPTTNQTAAQCLAQWSLQSLGCDGDHCRARINVNGTSFWVKPPALSGEVVIAPYRQSLLRLANRITVDVSQNVAHAIDPKLRFVTEGGFITEAYSPTIRRAQLAADIGIVIGQQVISVGVGAIPGLGDATGTGVDSLGQLLTAYTLYSVNQLYDKLNQQAVKSKEGQEAALVALSLAGAYSAAYESARKSTAFVTHVCIETGASNGKFTSFVNAMKDTPKLAFAAPCKDHERFELWATSANRGRVASGDEVYLRSYSGLWLRATPSSGDEPELSLDVAINQRPGNQYKWRIYSRDGGLVVDPGRIRSFYYDGGPGNTPVPIASTSQYIPNGPCTVPLRGSDCSVEIGLQSVANGKWLYAASDSLLVGAQLNVFKKGTVELRQQPATKHSDSFEGHMALHRWFGSYACAQGPNIAPSQCGNPATNEYYSTGYNN